MKRCPCTFGRLMMLNYVKLQNIKCFCVTVTTALACRHWTVLL